jgi:hypothetical protein
LSEYDLSGKTIVPLCTHGGGGLGRIGLALAAHLPGRQLPTLLIADVIRIHFVVSAGYGIIVWNAWKNCPRLGSEMGSNLEQIKGLTRQVQV